MKKVLIRSIIAALIVEGIGASINLISYFTAGRLLLAHTLAGGEWMGWIGFGVFLSKIYPMTSSPLESANGRMHLAFDLTSFLVTVGIAFAAAFIINLAAYKSRDHKETF